MWFYFKEKKGGRKVRKTYAKSSFATKRYVPYDLITEYLNDIFSMHKEQDGYICFRSGPKGHAAQSWLDVDKVSTNLKIELYRHDYRDTFFSFSTYQKSRCPKHSEASVRNIFAWSIDVDYKNESARPLDVYNYIMENVNLPIPNYVEYGHRLRMIYIFAEPLRLFTKQRTKLIRGFQFLQQSFCKIINEELGFMGESFGAEANPCCSFFRIPGSVNTKDGSTIQIKHLSEERYTMQELFEEWIPNAILDPSGNKKEWYDDWKEKTVSISTKEKSIAKRFNSVLLWERRLPILEELRTMPNPHRKKLCFFYANGLMHTKRVKNGTELMGALRLFNEGFLNPLPPNVLNRTFKWNAANMRCYRYSDERLAMELEVDRTYFSSKNRKERDAIRYKEKREYLITLGKTKSQKIEKRRNRVTYLLSQKKTVEEIATAIGVSLSTAKRDIQKCKQMKQNITKTKSTFYDCGIRFVRTFEEIQKNITKKISMIVEPITSSFFLGNLDLHREGGACFAASIQGQSSSPTATHPAINNVPANIRNSCPSTELDTYFKKPWHIYYLERWKIKQVPEPILTG